ncbi:MAG: hypothetical protein ACRDKI_08820 [Solirubrobacterales bacterium]
MRARIAFAICFSAAALLCAAPGAQADTATLGQIAPTGATGSGDEVAFVQTNSGAAPSYQAPYDGTVTAFAFRAGTSFALDGSDYVRLQVFRPIGAGAMTLVGLGPKVSLVAQSPGSRVEAPASIAVKAGDLIGGLFKATQEGNTTPLFVTAAGGDLPQQASSPLVPVGSATGVSDTAPNQRVNIEATLSYTPPPPPFADVFPPAITHFKTLFKRFRFKPKGAVVSRRAHPGTTISLILSEPATVTFAVDKLFRGKITNGVCKKAGVKNRKHRRCTKTIRVHAFARALATGANELFYSARYLDPKQRIGILRPGPYRMTAVATDYVGNASAPETLNFKVRH